MLTPVARGLALFLGGFTLLNLAGDLRFHGAGANIWWIDFAVLPVAASRLLLLLIGTLLLAYALVPRVRRWRIVVAFLLLGAAIIAAAINAAGFYRLLAQRSITSSFPL